MTNREQRQTQVGPFRIVDQLGVGGMGVVYRAVHVATNDVVALKTLRAPDELLLAGIRREISALARLGHPGVVRIVAEGVHEGVPWYAMDLVYGETLSRYGVETLAKSHRGDTPASGVLAATSPPRPDQWWTESVAGARDAWPPAPPEMPPTRRVPAPVESPPRADEATFQEAMVRVLTLVRRLCSPLGFLHGEGIVHRDLKPDNVLVRKGDFPVIVDFGLADWFGTAANREAVRGAGGVVGTPAFMAPEQIKGEAVDARADLYALGCILYRLVTGRQVFQVAGGREMLRAHCEATPVPPSDLAPGAPPELDRLVLALLEKDPRDRPGHADDVAALLARIGAQNGGALAGTAPPARPYLYRARCAGRAHDLAVLVDCLDRLAASRGGLVLIGGESGIGKTRLATELAQRATAMGIRVLLGDCPDVRARPLEAFRKPLRTLADQCRGWGRAETDRIIGARGKVLALYAPELNDLPGQERYRAPVELSAQEARHRLCTFVLETLAAASDDEPLLVILDDLQWADELSLAVLALALRSGRCAGAPVLLAGTYRSEEVSEALAELIASDKTTNVRFGRLAIEAVGAMVADMLALRSAPAAFIELLARSSEGNPFFVAEYLRLAVARAVLRRDEMGRWRILDDAGQRAAIDGGEEGGAAVAQMFASLPLPGSLRALVGSHLEALPDAARAVLEAAVVGREVSGEVLAQMVGAPELMASDVVTQLLRRSLMAEVGGGRLGFAHDKIREVAYEGIASEQLPARHRAAAAAIEHVFGTDNETWFAALAKHWDRAGDGEKARAYYRKAAQVAAERYAWQEADAAFDTYFRLAPAGPDRETTATRIAFAARALSIRGLFGDAEAVARRARADAEALADAELVAEADEVLGSVLRSQNRYAEARASYERAHEHYAHQDDRARTADLVVLLGVIAWAECQLDSACTLWQSALTVFRDLGDQPKIATVLHNLAFALTDLRQYDVAKNLFEEALAIPRTLGERHLEGTTLGGLGRLSLLQGNLPAARGYFEKALLINREVGELWAEAITTGCLAQIEMFQGHGEAARAGAEKAVALNRQVGNRRDEAIAMSVLAWGEACAGALDIAFAQFEQSLAIHREIHNTASEALTLWQYAIWRRRIGDYDGASVLLDQVEGLGTRINRPLALGLARCERGHHALARNQPAQGFLDEAQRAVEAPDIYLRDAIARLRRALERAARALPLLHGEDPADTPQSDHRATSTA